MYFKLIAINPSPLGVAKGVPVLGTCGCTLIETAFLLVFSPDIQLVFRAGLIGTHPHEVPDAMLAVPVVIPAGLLPDASVSQYTSTFTLHPSGMGPGDAFQPPNNAPQNE